MRLHHLYEVGLHHELPLSRHLLSLGAFLGRRLGGLLLHILLRDDLVTNLLGSILHIDFDLLMLSKHGLVHLFEKHFNLGRTKLHHSRSELLLTYLGSLHDL